MKPSPTLAIIIVILVLVIAGALYWAFTPRVQAPTTTATSTPSAAQNVVTSACDAGKDITAAYSSNSVHLSLSDGRMFTLPQTVSGSGIRYEQGAGTPQNIVFSSEGSNAFLTENGTMTYTNCVAGTNTGGTSGMKSYTDAGHTFTFTYPNTFTLSGGGVGYSQDWMLNSSASGLLLVKLTLPGPFEPKTNFGDATLTVGTSSDPGAVAQCLSVPVNGPPVQKSVVTINGTTYTKYVYSDAAAGNLYQTTSYRTVYNGQCYAVEYTIHSSNIGNYPPNSGITAFDQAKVQNALESVVESFKFL